MGLVRQLHRRLRAADRARRGQHAAQAGDWQQLRDGPEGRTAGRPVNASLALFRYDQENRAVTDVASGFACDDWYCSTAAGKVRSQGVEAEISGEVLSGLQLFAGYLQHHQVPRRPGQQGRVFSQWTPKHMLRAWADYPASWTASAGAPGRLHQPEPYPGLRAHLQVATVWNARLAYQLTPEVNLAVNANNLFDKSGCRFNQLNGSNNYGEPQLHVHGQVHAAVLSASVRQGPFSQRPVPALARLVQGEVRAARKNSGALLRLRQRPAKSRQRQVRPVLAHLRLDAQRQHRLLQGVHQLAQGPGACWAPAPRRWPAATPASGRAPAAAAHPGAAGSTARTATRAASTSPGTAR
jgi:hypothetical protein